MKAQPTDKNLDGVIERQVANTGAKTRPGSNDTEGFDIPPANYGKRSERDVDSSSERDVTAAAPGRISPYHKSTESF